MSVDEKTEMSAGIKTPDNSDQIRFQRRHFPHKTSSNIFFCDYFPDDNAPSKNGVDRNDSFLSAGIDTRHANQEQLERHHFDAPPEDCMQLKSENQDEQVYSVGTSESTETDEDNLEPNKTEKRHFGDKTSSNIFFSGLPSEESTLRDRSNVFDFRIRKG